MMINTAFECVEGMVGCCGDEERVLLASRELIRCVRRHDTSSVSQLLGKIASNVTLRVHMHEIVNAAEPTTGRTPLMLACCEGYVDIVRFLLDGGANVNAEQPITFYDDGEYDDEDDLTTALLLATRNGHEATVRALLASGADVSVTNSLGQTPLMVAVVKDFGGIVDALLGTGKANTEQVLNGATPLFWAIFNSNSSIVKSLLDHGARIKRRVKGISLIEHASLNRSPRIVSMLNAESGMRIMVALCRIRRFLAPRIVRFRERFYAPDGIGFHQAMASFMSGVQAG